MKLQDVSFDLVNIWRQKLHFRVRASRILSESGISSRVSLVVTWSLPTTASICVHLSVSVCVCVLGEWHERRRWSVCLCPQLMLCCCCLFMT